MLSQENVKLSIETHDKDLRASRIQPIVRRPLRGLSRVPRQTLFDHDTEGTESTGGPISLMHIIRYNKDA